MGSNSSFFVVSMDLWQPSPSRFRPVSSLFLANPGRPVAMQILLVTCAANKRAAPRVSSFSHVFTDSTLGSIVPLFVPSKKKC